MASQHDPILIYTLGISWDHLPLFQPNHAFDGHCHVLLPWFASKMSQRTASGLHRQSLQRCYQNLFEEVRSRKWHGHINHVSNMSNMSAWECQTSKAQRHEKGVILEMMMMMMMKKGGGRTRRATAAGAKATASIDNDRELNIRICW